MMKNIIFLLILFPFTNLIGQTTPIPDANFEQFLVNQGIDTNGVNGNILDVDAQAVTVLNLSSVNTITDITGLNAFVNVTDLDLGDNLIADIAPTSLTSLTTFRTNDNSALATIDLTQNIVLESFFAHGDFPGTPPPITQIDLSQNVNLISINGDFLDNVDDFIFPITPTLTSIFLRYLADLTVNASGLTNLENFSIGGWRSDVDLVLPNTTTLTNLRINSIEIETIDLSTFTNLETLYLWGTYVQNLTLPTSNALDDIFIILHDIRNPLDFSVAPNLTDLDITSNRNEPLVVDLTQNPILEQLDLSRNDMNSIDITQNPLLRTFTINVNNLTSLDVTQNPILSRLEATTNQLPSLDLTQNLVLQYLSLGFNQLPSLNITQNTELESININNNLFTGSGLDLSQNSEMFSMNISNNQVETLDFSNTIMRSLDISNNIFSGNQVLNDFHDKIATKANLSDVFFKANNNLLTGTIPNFYSIYTNNNPSVVQHRRWWFHIENNYFHFGDFENQHLDLVSLLTTQSIGPSPAVVMVGYTYAPQEKVNTIDNETRNAGESITLTTAVRGSQNRYQWFKDGAEITDAPDAPEYTITNLNTCDAGVYHSEITSDLIPFENANPPGTSGKNLLLVRNDITLSVNATKECVTLNMPLTNVPINSGIEWNDNPGACGYKITIRNIDTNTVLLPIEDVGEVTVYNYANDFPANTNIGVTITPYFDDGDFSGCSEESFTTNTTAVAPACTSLASPTNGDANVSANITGISWNPANGADAYSIAITSTSGNNNMALTDLGDVLTYTFPTSFQNGDVVSVNIIPYNTVDDAVGPCVTQSFTIGSAVPAVPNNCADLVSPLANATDVAVDIGSISWDAVADATTYRVSINGSTSNVNDITNQDITGTSFTLPGDFDNGETVSVVIIPFNTAGDAVGCDTQQNFTLTASVSTRPFITTWETTTPNETITIPTRPFFGVYDYTIDWGDGTVNTNVAGDITHSFATPGIQTVSITGTFPQIYFFGTATDRDKILTIEQWGDIEWASFSNSFQGCSRLNITNPAIDIPNLTQVTNLASAFSGATSFNGDITQWNVSGITNMGRLFQGATIFNQNIENWNVSNVQSMSRMFESARAFNQDIGDWDVGNVTNMEVMFAIATSFNQDISRWDVRQVTSMNTMFGSAAIFNQDIGRWNVSNVENMTQMFMGATAFNQDLSLKPGLGTPAGDA
jgi:surface protein